MIEHKKPTKDSGKEVVLSTVKVRMAYGSQGAEPRPWIVGPPLLSKTYRLCGNCETEVTEADAKVLLKGGPKLGGRVFVRAGQAPPKGRSDE